MKGRKPDRIFRPAVGVAADHADGWETILKHYRRSYHTGRSLAEAAGEIRIRVSMEEERHRSPEQTKMRKTA